MTWVKTLAWIKKYWQILVGVLFGFGSFITYYLKSKNIKKVLQKANESHEKENKINEGASEALATGLEELRKNTIQDIVEKQKEISKKEENLSSEKKDFIESQKKSKDLAKDIASAIGADFVETDKK